VDEGEGRMSDRNFDRRGKIWHKSRRKRKTGWSSKSDNPLERKETHAIGLRAAGKLGLFASKPVRASEPSSARGRERPAPKNAPVRPVAVRKAYRKAGARARGNEGGAKGYVLGREAR
jgi:hypothetical protein